MKQPKITAKQEGGDDGYCYVIRINGREFVNGLTRAEVPYYKKRALEHWQKQNGLTKPEASVEEILYNQRVADFLAGKPLYPHYPLGGTNDNQQGKDSTSVK